jgi:hypothetical protein
MSRRAEEKASFLLNIVESDPEIFCSIPRLAVKHAIAPIEALTEQNIPYFMHDHLSKLEQLRQKQAKLNADKPDLSGEEIGTITKGIRKQIDDITIALSRETNFIASLQKAIEMLAVANPLQYLQTIVQRIEEDPLHTNYNYMLITHNNIGQLAWEVYGAFYEICKKAGILGQVNPEGNSPNPRWGEEVFLQLDRTDLNEYRLQAMEQVLNK